MVNDMIYQGLHETVIRDIVDTINYGIDSAETFGLDISRSKNSLATASSLSKATEGLVLIFPHLCTESISPETGSMLTRAIETKAVSLLQIAFSAFSITNSEDAVDFVKKFHTNVGSGKMTVDKFIDTMDSISNESSVYLNGIERKLVKSVLENFKQMDCYFEEDLLETSINNYQVVSRYGRYVVTEAPASTNPPKGYKSWQDYNAHMQANKAVADGQDSYWRNIISQRANDIKQDQLDHQKEKDRLARKDQIDRDKADKEEREAKEKTRQAEREDDKEYQKSRDKVRDKFDQDNLARKDIDLALKGQDILNKQAKDRFDMIRQQILPSDVKKANDMVPTMMIINFNTRDEKLGTVICSQAVIGVKAKLYPASSNDIINKILTKHVDNNVFLKLMRVTTREISFVRDFLFAIDNAKLTAMSCSVKGSETNKMLRVLERRALKGKIRRKLNLQNSYKAITTFTISREEADYIKTYNNIDLFNKSVIRKIMESLNLMMFIIADDSEECIHLIMDSGDDTYERISYTHLEREVADGGYKKAINLMTKVVR